MQNTTYLIGYGTLLHKGSLGQTIGRTPAHAKKIEPVVVRGFRRLFNLRPDHYAASGKLGTDAVEAGAMNVEYARGFEFNALAFPVTEFELGALDERERYYERRTVDVYVFPAGSAAGLGHLYVGDPNSRWIERDPARLMPLWRDVVWARSGAYRVGSEFGEFFDRTTFLADGSTLMIDVYRDYLLDTSDVDEPG